MNQNKFIKTFTLFVLVLSMLILSISPVSALCENSIIYYGTCTPNGNVDIILNNNIITQTTCNSGLFATHIGAGGESCKIKKGDSINFKIDNVDSGTKVWTGNFVNFIALDGTPILANILPIINVNFNNNSDFKSGDNFTCSAHITDSDGGILQNVHSSIISLVNSSYSYVSVNDMLSTLDCNSISQSEAICDVKLNFDLPVGGVECGFYANDGVDNSQSSSNINVVNNLPSLHASIINYTGPVDTELMFTLNVLDDDVDQSYSVSKNFQFGILNESGSNYIFKWTPSSNNTGNYTLGFTVNDGYDSSALIVPVVISYQSPVIQPPTPPPPSSGGGSHRNYVKVNETLSGNGGGCYSYKDVENREIKCIGKAGQTVMIKQRAFCWGNFTGPIGDYKLDKYTCPLPPEPVEKEIITPPQKPEPPKELNNWWLWLIIGLVLVIIGSVTVYELNQRGVFDHNVNHKFESNIFTPSKKESSNIKSKQVLTPKPKQVKNKPSEPPKVSSHINIKDVEAKIKKANTLFSKGKIDDVKELIHEISSDYKMMNPSDKGEVYQEYMKLYERIRSAQ